MMRVQVKSVLDCPPALAWDEVQTSRLLADVTWPLLRFAGLPGEELPTRWPAGGSVTGRIYLFGVIPLGRHTIRWERVDADKREMLSREDGGLVRRWDHLIRVAEDNGRTRYSDTIELNAGLLTLPVWLFAIVFYRHRQRRWRRIARRLAAEAGQRKSD